MQSQHQSPTVAGSPGPLAAGRPALRRLAIVVLWIGCSTSLIGAPPDRSHSTQSANPRQPENGQADWPQFRGPGGQGITAEEALPIVWSESENLVWKSVVPGRGWSSPVVVGTDIWLTTATGSGRALRGICLDKATGRIRLLTEVLFEVDPESKGLGKAGQAAPTPLVSGERIYLHFGAHGTACLDREGNVLWRRVIPYYHHHGPGGSPELVGDTLILICDGHTGPFYDQLERPGVMSPQFVVGLDARTGEIRWQTPRAGQHSYATPLAIEVDGRRQVVCPGGDGVWAYDPADGRELWSHRFVGHSVVPRPVVAGNLVCICTGYHNAELRALNPSEVDEQGEARVVWKLTSGVPFVPSPIVVDRLIYLITDDGIVSAVDSATGSVKWKHRLGGRFSASPIAAGKLIYLCAEDGVTHVLRAGSIFRRQARNELQGTFLASPAVSENRLFLRSETHLYCVGTDVSGGPVQLRPVQLIGAETAADGRDSKVD